MTQTDREPRPEPDRAGPLMVRVERWFSGQSPWVAAAVGGGLLLVVAAVFALALAGNAPDPEGEPAAAMTTVVTTGSDDNVVEQSDPEAAFRAAVERSSLAGSYRFEATLRLLSGPSQTSLRMSGWVDGPDREVVVQTATGEVLSTTRVIDGVATFDDGSGPREIAVEGAGASPGFDLLEQVELTRVTETEAGGAIGEEALAGFQIDDQPPKAGEIVVAYSEFIDGYTMRDPDGAWEIEVAFLDYGGQVRG